MTHYSLSHLLWQSHVDCRQYAATKTKLYFLVVSDEDQVGYNYSQFHHNCAVKAARMQSQVNCFGFASHTPSTQRCSLVFSEPGYETVRLPWLTIGYAIPASSRHNSSLIQDISAVQAILVSGAATNL